MSLALALEAFLETSIFGSFSLNTTILGFMNGFQLSNTPLQYLEAISIVLSVIYIVFLNTLMFESGFYVVNSFHDRITAKFRKLIS